MNDPYLLLTPILMLGVLALARFVGCSCIVDGGAKTIEFVETTSLGDRRNNFTGWVGMAIDVGPDKIEVTHLGRTMKNGTTQSHVVKIVEPAGEGGVDLGAVEIQATAEQPDYAYQELDDAVTLTPNQRYYVVSHETDGGDFWHDINTEVYTTDVAQVTSGVFNDDATPGYVLAESGSGQTFGPVDFKYRNS
jgi:hypothetical protein